MERVPKSVPVRLKAMAAGDHPDPDLLTALAEQALPERERAQVLLHLSRCSNCREVLALAVPPATEPSPSLDTGQRSWFQWPVLRWAAAGACVVIVGSAVMMMKRDTMMTAHRGALRTEAVASIQTQSDSAGFKSPAASPPASRADVAPEQKEAGEAVADSPRSVSDKSVEMKALKKQMVIMNAAPTVAPRTGFATKAGGAMAGAAAGSGMGGKLGSGSVYRPRAQFAATPAARPAPATSTWQQREKELSMQARNGADMAPAEVSQQPAVSQRNEVVAAEPASPAVQTEQPETAEARGKYEAPGKAKAATNAPGQDRAQSADEGALTSFTYSSANKVTAAKSVHGLVTGYSPVSRWTISSDGQLQHSTDAGRTWQPIAVAEHTSFRALSANGPDLWVGGAAGQLYHSTDSGGRWTQVKPSSGSSVLSGDIAAIEFTDTRQGKITTANGEIWTTNDGGQTWRKQP